MARIGVMKTALGYALLWSGSVLAAESVHTRRVSAQVIKVLREDFGMAEVAAIIKASPDRTRSQAYLRSQPDRYHFVATQEQDPMILDGYSAGDPGSSVVGYSLFYHGATGPLAILDASVNPTQKKALNAVEGLVRQSLDSMPNPDGSRMYFLGIYDFDVSRVLKIMVRKAETPLGLDYAIRYAVSER